MVQRSPGRVGAAFRSHNTLRAPCLLRVAAASDCGCIETIQLPVTICWWSVLWQSGLPGVVDFALSGCQKQKKWEKFLLLLRRGLTWPTATTLGMSAWSTVSGNGKNNRGADARRGAGGFRGGGGCSAAFTWRNHTSCCFRQLFAAAAAVVAADSHSVAVTRVAQRHLAAGGGGGPPPHHDHRQQQARGDWRGWSALHAPKARWYARQVDRSLVDFDTVRRLCRDTQMRDHHRRVAAVLGCITATSHPVPWSASDALALLPTTERAAAVATLISHRVVPHGGLGSALGVVLTDPHATREDVWALLQSLTVVVDDRGSLLNDHWVGEVVRRVVSTTSSGSGSGKGAGAVSRERIVTALTLGECVLDFEALSKLCRESGLWYESTAYRSAAAGTLLEVNPPCVTHGNGDSGSGSSNHDVHDGRDDGACYHGSCGFGQPMTQLLQALRNGSTATPSLVAVIESLRSQMSPVVATYTMYSVVAALTRAEWERGGGGGGTPRGITPLEYLQLATPLHGEAAMKRASKIHFDVGLGTASTAQLLLPLCCRSWCGTVRLMQHTRHAGVGPAMESLRILMELAPSGRYYLLARLRHDSSSNSSCNLLLEARAEAAVEAFAEEDEEEEEAALAEVTGLWRRLAGVATSRHQLPQGGGCALWTLPASCVSRMAAAIPQLPGSLVSYWIRLLLRHGRHDSIAAVMQTAADRGVVPDMVTLVEVLEFSNDAMQLQRVVHTVRSLFPDSAPAVFRAFVERTAGHVGDVSPQTWDAALHLLSAVSVLGLVHYPRKCMESIAACAPTPVVLAMLQLLSEDGDGGGGGGGGSSTRSPSPTPAPLEWSALHRLIRSAEMAGLRASVDIIAVPPGSNKAAAAAAAAAAAWWSSDVVAASVPLSTALYKRQAVGLWHLALQDVARGGVARRNAVEVHHAIRLASFGTESTATLLRSVMATRLLQEQQEDLTLGGSGRKKVNDRNNTRTLTSSRRMVTMVVEEGRKQQGPVTSRQARADDAMLVTTLGCVAGALVAQGRWESALRVIPLGVAHLPPLLRLAQLKALQCSDDFGEHATMLLNSESWHPAGVARRGCRNRGNSSVTTTTRRRRRRRRRMPDGVRRLLVKLQMVDAFRCVAFMAFPPQDGMGRLLPTELEETPASTNTTSSSSSSSSSSSGGGGGGGGGPRSSILASNLLSPPFRFHVYNLPERYGEGALRLLADAWPQSFCNRHQPKTNYTMLDWRHALSLFTADVWMVRHIRSHPAHTHNPAEADVFIIPIISHVYHCAHVSHYMIEVVRHIQAMKPSYTGVYNQHDHFMFWWRWGLHHRSVKEFWRYVQRHIPNVKLISYELLEIMRRNKYQDFSLALKPHFLENVFNVIVPYPDVAPALRQPPPPPATATDPTATRPIFFYFAGTHTIGGIRRWIRWNCQQKQDTDTTCVYETFSNTSVSSLRLRVPLSYPEKMKRSVFCGHAAGDGLSSRRPTSAILAGCIPVIICDLCIMPFESVLDYSKFAVFLREDVVIAGRMVQTLRAIPKNDVRRMQTELLRVRSRFVYNKDGLRPNDALDTLVQELAMRGALLRQYKRWWMANRNLSSLPQDYPRDPPPLRRYTLPRNAPGASNFNTL